jgi:ribose 5-phosphate isomerase B
MMRIGIAADHGGFELKNRLAEELRKANYEVTDFGAYEFMPGDDYPDFVVPLAEAVAHGDVDRGIALCGSGIGAGIAANKVCGVRAGVIHDHFTARQGVEDDNVNLICIGGRTVGPTVAWDLVQTFLSADFSGAERHRRRLTKVAALENAPAEAHAERTGACKSE